MELNMKPGKTEKTVSVGCQAAGATTAAHLALGWRGSAIFC